ncbi:MAG: hypothetical protein WB869_03400 [Candidatus Acidiferrales bacterium]
MTLLGSERYAAFDFERKSGLDAGRNGSLRVDGVALSTLFFSLRTIEKNDDSQGPSLRS